jgi:hypothetical protein
MLEHLHPIVKLIVKSHLTIVIWISGMQRLDKIRQATSAKKQKINYESAILTISFYSGMSLLK